jgi:hypothetical protein
MWPGGRALLDTWGTTLGLFANEKKSETQKINIKNTHCERGVGCGRAARRCCTPCSCRGEGNDIGPCLLLKKCQKTRNMNIRNTHCERGVRCGQVLLHTLQL